MKRAFLIAAALAAAQAWAQLPAPGQPGAIDDPRYCGEPVREPDGAIKRSRAVLRAFTKVFPCPSTLKATASCEGWAIDHTIPLASGGCDAPINLHWLPDAIKSCASPACKDRWERTYHAMPRGKVNLPPAVSKGK